MKFLLLCLAVSAMAQTPTEVNYAVYSMLFRVVDMHETLAAQTEAVGKDPEHKSRKWLQDQTGLTDQEWNLVRPIVLDAISGVNANLKQLAAATTAGQPLTDAQKKAIGAIHIQRQQLVLAHMQQIASVLGGSRFQQFDNAVRGRITSNLVVKPISSK